jgi:uncharacterized protein YqjF (DUF2071 family)
MESIFLTAEWQYLVMANYEIDANLLHSYLPAHVEIDTWNGKTYISLVGFLFKNTKILDFSIPFHKQFEEVNLRFYVRYRQDGQWKRGVVFIREIVPLPTISLVANVLYREPYSTMPMKHSITNTNNQLSVQYEWKNANQWNKLAVIADSQAQKMQPNSEAEFITEHYWGYTKWNEKKTAEYQVEHPKWLIYPIKSYEISCDTKNLYGETFVEVLSQNPTSVLMAQGSEIVVRKGRFL